MTWLEIVLGASAGLVLVAGALAFAFRPELMSRRKPSRMAPPSGNDPNRDPIGGLSPDPD